MIERRSMYDDLDNLYWTTSMYGCNYSQLRLRISGFGIIACWWRKHTGVQMQGFHNHHIRGGFC